MYQKIVVAFDGSEYSKAALLEASNWIKKHGGSAVLVHAVFFDEEEFGAIPEQLEKRMIFGKHVCCQAKEEISASLGINLESIICEGEPHETIVEIAGSKGSDLIAIGTHGRKGIKRLLMGSVTSAVIAGAPCDVLVVKKPCTVCTGTYGSVLVPFDGSQFSKKALDRACALAKADGGSVTVLYVIPRYEEMIGFVKNDSIRQSLRQEASKIIDSAKDIAGAVGITVNTVVEDGYPSDSIIESAKKLKTDLIIIGSYGWQGINRAIMGSTTERVIMDAPCPVLAVR
ncbi:MAG: universal stress protein [Nitrospirae bacterium]|nr:universal stress protein [Nitrospirota bacterium]